MMTKSKASFLLAALLSLLLLIGPIEAQELWIEVIPLSAKMKRFPIKVYWKESETCPAEFNKVLKKTLDTAIIFLRKSIWRFMEENDGKYDKFVVFRLEYTDNPKNAQIIISGDQLGEEVAGITVIGTVDGKLVPPTEIYYDCEVVLKPVVPAFNVVLHELLHGVGLGHAYFDKVDDQWEIMAESKREGEPTIYVSTLDLHALYQIWFENYRGDKVILPQNLEFREVKPYVVELEELKKIYEELHRKYGVLEEEVTSLKDDLKILEKRVENLEQNVTVIHTRVSSLEKKAETLSENLETVSSEVSKVAEGLESVNTTMNRWMGEVRRSLQTLATRISENQEAIQEHSQLLASQQHAIETLNTTLQEVMKYLKILIVLTAISLAIGAIALFKTIKKKN